MDHGSDEQLSASRLERVRKALSSVEAAALSGFAAAVLMTLSAYLLARQPGVRSSGQNLEWYTNPANQRLVVTGLNLAPLGVVAFLWFIAVVRRRLGEREDQFFATVFFGSGVAFGVLVLVATAVVASPTLVVWLGTDPRPNPSTVSIAHALWYGLWGVAASRLVGVFMAATSMVGLRFGAFPRWLSSFGIVVGLCLGLTGAFAGPLDFLFPLWLAVVSVTLLVSGRRRRSDQQGADSV